MVTYENEGKYNKPIKLVPIKSLLLLIGTIGPGLTVMLADTAQVQL